jgi:hypothetical protein
MCAKCRTQTSRRLNFLGCGCRLRQTKFARSMKKRATKKRRRRSQVAKAMRMAAREIESLADRSALPEERIRRKRRLLKGPRELREVPKNNPRK